MTKKHDIIWFERTDSTNEDARRHISDIDNLSVLSALEQTAGRGQRGNTWTSSPGENLLFSIVLKFGPDGQGKTLPPLPAEKQFAISTIAALSVCDFLNSYGIKAKIKWPNDIYAGEKKICGMLIENSSRGKYISSSIIGIGLNINQKNFDVNLPNPTSMVLCIQNHNCRTEQEYCYSEESGSFDIRECLEDFMEIYTSYIDRFLTSDSDLSPLHQRYLDLMWRLGEPSDFLDYTALPSGHLDGPMNISPRTGSIPSAIGSVTSAEDLYKPVEFKGIIRGLSDIGNLLVEDLSSGLIREFGFKEIGYIL